MQREERERRVGPEPNHRPCEPMLPVNTRNTLGRDRAESSLLQLFLFQRYAKTWTGYNVFVLSGLSLASSLWALCYHIQNLPFCNILSRALSLPLQFYKEKKNCETLNQQELTAGNTLIIHTLCNATPPV